MQVNGPPYWDNELLGFQPSTGTYEDAQPVSEHLFNQ
jgi:hypothetical protein